MSYIIQCPVCSFENDYNQININKKCVMCYSKIELNDDVLANINGADESEKLINNNYIEAMENIPEFFTPHSCIYLTCKINNQSVKFLVDTGAETSVISSSTVDSLGLSHLIDKRVMGALKGVGSDTLSGRIYMIDLDIDDFSIPCSFMVCNNPELTPILGMDMLQAHQLTLDFKNKKINISGKILKFEEK